MSQALCQALSHVQQHGEGGPVHPLGVPWPALAGDVEGSKAVGWCESHAGGPMETIADGLGAELPFE